MKVLRADTVPSLSPVSELLRMQLRKVRESAEVLRHPERLAEHGGLVAVIRLFETEVGTLDVIAGGYHTAPPWEVVVPDTVDLSAPRPLLAGDDPGEVSDHYHAHLRACLRVALGLPPVDPPDRPALARVAAGSALHDAWTWLDAHLRTGAPPPTLWRRA